MTKKFRGLLEKFPLKRRLRIEEHTLQLLADMPCQKLRKALQLTQQQVAATLSMNQAAVSKMEGQIDVYISTLRYFIESMGGELRIVAHFPQGEVEVDQFKQEEAGQVSAT